jgi:hypothetical protein
MGNPLDVGNPFFVYIIRAGLKYDFVSPPKNFSLFLWEKIVVGLSDELLASTPYQNAFGIID